MNENDYKKAVKTLNKWSYAYYVDDNPLASDEEYDNLYKEVEAYEEQNPNQKTYHSGIVL